MFHVPAHKQTSAPPAQYEEPLEEPVAQHPPYQEDGQVQLQRQHQQAARAFFQDPTPRLGKALHQIEGAIRYEKRRRRAAALKEAK